MTSFAQVFRPELANAEDMTQFHSDEYIEFLPLAVSSIACLLVEGVVAAMFVA